MSGKAAIVVVLLIVIVAAFFLMRGDIQPEGGDSDIIKAVSSGEAVECDLTIDLRTVNVFNDVDPPSGIMTARVKVEAPNVRMEGRLKGLDFIYISDGGVGYVYVPIIDDWYMYSPDVMGVGMPTSHNLIDNLRNPRLGVSLSCQETGDIPDSEFRLPAGVIAKNMPDVMGDLESYMYG